MEGTNISGMSVDLLLNQSLGLSGVYDAKLMREITREFEIRL